MLEDLQRTLHQLRWADACIETVLVEYDSVRLTVADDGHRNRQVSCDGLVGLELVGFWDEMIIESVRLCDDGDLLRRSQALIDSRRRSPAGNVARNAAACFQLDVALIDGCTLRVAAKELRVSPV